MRWELGRRSTNVEDRRGFGGGGIALGGGTMVVLALVAMFFGVDPSVILQTIEQVQVQAPQSEQAPAGAPANDEQADFVAAILGDTEDTWKQIFAQGLGSVYEPPHLVLFTDAVQSACGFGSAAVGPFYCPADKKVYLDLSFFRDLEHRFGAPGDFARAYVIAHEVGHHVQKLAGISDRIEELSKRRDQQQRNDMSVRLELQADCFAGVWGHYANQQRKMLEPGDVEEGLAAAAAIGDDRLQRRSGGVVQPESWTHGSSEQRVRWLRRGLEGGRVDGCNTFGAEQL